MPSNNKANTQDRLLHRKMLALWKRGESEYCEVRGSNIHGRGVYATTFIPKDTRVIEYVGEDQDGADQDQGEFGHAGVAMMSTVASRQKAGCIAAYYRQATPRKQADPRCRLVCIMLGLVTLR